jgi:hypothetical protein
MYSHALCSRQQCVPDFDDYVWVSNMKDVVIYPKREGLVDECTNVFLKLFLAYSMLMSKIRVEDVVKGLATVLRLATTSFTIPAEELISLLRPLKTIER